MAHLDLFISLDSSCKARSHVTEKSSKKKSYKTLFEKIKYCFYVLKIVYYEEKQYALIKEMKFSPNMCWNYHALYLIPMTIKNKGY
ncbi:hypothetical protein V1478_012386 [Vespula squamosa]|uniref:Uncharacterized protein n=1 Tax=Vespula squamosa TaxID=30214 RepID=A0ABD2AFA2_VESSQ